jgi:vacuolar-type H+-ATPase subunit E/Vma4
MGFEELSHELLKSAEAEAKKIIAAAEKSSEKILEEAREKAASEERAAKKEAASYSKQESSERLTSARLTSKKTVDSAREEAVDSNLLEVWKSFKAANLKKSTYPQLMQELLEEGLGELGSREATIYVRDEDRALLPGCKTARLPSGFSGGLIIESANGKIRINKTLEEIFSQKKGMLRKKIYDMLF